MARLDKMRNAKGHLSTAELRLPTLCPAEEGLQALDADCPDLQRMDVANFQLVSKEGLHALYAVGPGWEHIVAASCQLVSEEGLQVLNADCSGYCQLVSEEGAGCGLPGFAAHGRCELPAGQQGGPLCTLSRRPSLQHTVAANGQLVSKEGTQVPNADCPDLQRMDVANCQLVSKEGLHALYASGPGLQHTVAANCQLVSEDGLQALNADCPGFAAHGRR
jgi:hypothetical protein